MGGQARLIAAVDPQVLGGRNTHDPIILRRKEAKEGKEERVENMAGMPRYESRRDASR